MKKIIISFQVYVNVIGIPVYLTTFIKEKKIKKEQSIFYKNTKPHKDLLLVKSCLHL